MSRAETDHQIDRGAAQGSERLWSNRDFLALWIGQGISDMGTAITQTAVPLLVIAKTGSGLQMGLIGALQALPAAVFTLFAGVVADRWNRRWIMFWADLARGVLLAWVAFAPALLGVPGLSALYVAVVPLSLLHALFFAAYAASIPSLVGRGQLATANAALLGVSAASFVIGPAVAALALAYLGPETLLGVDGATFIVSAMSLVLVRRPLHSSSRDTATSMLASVRNGLRFIRSSATLRPLTVFRAIAAVLQTLLVPAAAFFVTMDHKLPGAAFGFMVSAWAVGSLVGAVVSPRLARRRLGRALLVSHAFGGVATILTARSAQVPSLLAGVFAVGLCGAIVVNLSATLRQRTTPDELLGRVTSASDVLYDAMLPLGMVLSGALMEATGGIVTLMGIGALMAANALGFACSAALRRAGQA